MSNKNKGVNTGAGKDQSISVGEYQNSEEGSGGRGNRGREKACGTFGVWGTRKREMNCKYRINTIKKGKKM